MLYMGFPARTALELLLLTESLRTGRRVDNVEVQTPWLRVTKLGMKLRAGGTTRRPEYPRQTKIENPQRWADSEEEAARSGTRLAIARDPERRRMLATARQATAPDAYTYMGASE